MSIGCASKPGDINATVDKLMNALAHADKSGRSFVSTFRRCAAPCACRVRLSGFPPILATVPPSPAEPSGSMRGVSPVRRLMSP